MAIFGIISCDEVVQVDEKIRISASDSFITNDESAITKVEIEPDSGNGFITVFTTLGAQLQENWYLDWIYSTAGTKTISLKITTSGSPSTVTFSISVVNSTSDALLANDQDLKAIESDIMKWLPAGKSTWNFVHRKVQDRILTEIYKNRIFATDGTKLTKSEIIDKAEVREWASYLALAMIYGSIQNASNDVFIEKSKRYEQKASSYKEYSLNVLALDYNKDGTLADSEKMDFRSGGLIRR